MILANVAAAEMLEKKALPLIYRVHDEPSQEKVHNLQEFLKTLDLPFAKAGALRPSLFNRVLGQVRGEDYEPLVNEVVLRSQAQAEYSAENYGHFGLNLRRYAHFTSPIRRYADLIVHRALIRALGLGEGALPETETLEELSEVAAQISVTERRAMKAERETADRLIAHFLADRIGASFQGRISGVTRAGLFVKLSGYRRRRADPDPDAGNGIFQLRRDTPCARRLTQRCHAPAGGRRRRASGRSSPGSRRVAVRACCRMARPFRAEENATASKAPAKTSKSRPGRSPRDKDKSRKLKPGKSKSGKAKSGKSKKGKSWKRRAPRHPVWTRESVKGEKRDLWTAMKRGFRGRCPRCGEGKLFRAFLKVDNSCSACGLDFTPHRADDLPAYLVIVVVGHIVVPVVLCIETNYSPAGVAAAWRSTCR